MQRRQGITAKFHIKPNAKRNFLIKAHLVPYALQSKVEDELNQLQSSGVIKPVKFSEWTVPVVPVVKPDRSTCKSILLDEESKEYTTINTHTGALLL